MNERLTSYKDKQRKFQLKCPDDSIHSAVARCQNITNLFLNIHILVIQSAMRMWFSQLDSEKFNQNCSAITFSHREILLTVFYSLYFRVINMNEKEMFNFFFLFGGGWGLSGEEFPV